MRCECGLQQRGVFDEARSKHNYAQQPRTEALPEFANLKSRCKTHVTVWPERMPSCIAL